MTDAAYRHTCAQLRRATRYYHLVSANTDVEFLKYVAYHATEDGPGAMFTPEQLDRLDTLAGRSIRRGRPVQHGNYAPDAGDVLDSVSIARNRVDSP